MPLSRKMVRKIFQWQSANRYFVSEYTDGPSTRWNVIDRQTQEWVRRFSTEADAQAYADKLNKAECRCKHDRGGKIIGDDEDGYSFTCSKCGALT